MTGDPSQWVQSEHLLDSQQGPQRIGMFIKGNRYVTKRGEVRTSYSLVEVRHVDGKSQRRTLLNLGQDFSLPRETWSKVTTLVRESFDGQSSVELETLATPESKAARQIIQRLLAAGYRAEQSDDHYQAIAIQQIEYPPNATRSVGAERLALQAMDILGLDAALEKLGKTPPAIRTIKVCIAARLLKPRGRPIKDWLRRDSALLELLDLESRPITEARLYHAANKLWPNRGQTLKWMQRAFQDPGEELPQFRDFTYDEAITDEPPADAAIVLVLDRHGYGQGCKMVRGPGAFLADVRRIKAARSMLIVRAGQVTDRQLYRWSRAGVGWLCVNLDGFSMVEPLKSVKWDLANFATELRLHERRDTSQEQTCEETEAACRNFEGALTELHDNLSLRNRPSKYATVKQHITALIEEHSRVSHLYDIHLSRRRIDLVSSIDFKRVSVNQAASSPYRFALRTNLMEWEQDRLVRMLSRLLHNRRMFRALNHQGDSAGGDNGESMEQKKGTWTMALIAYQVVRLIEERLRGQGIDMEWSALRRKLSPWQRITSVLTSSDTTTFLERQDTQIELELRRIVKTLGLSPSRHLKRSLYRL